MATQTTPSATAQPTGGAPWWTPLVTWMMSNVLAALSALSADQQSQLATFGGTFFGAMFAPIAKGIVDDLLGRINRPNTVEPSKTDADDDDLARRVNDAVDRV